VKKIWNKTTGWRLPAIALLSAIFALFSVLTRAEPPAKTPLVAPPKSGYQTQVAGIGVVEPQSEVISIGSELPGIVRVVQVKVGDQVKAGDVLFKLDEREVDAQIATLRASVKSAEIQAKDLLAQYLIVKGIDDDRAVARDEVNRKQYAAELARARVAEFQSQLNQALTTKARLSVTAPIDGSILDVNVRPGEFAQTGFVSDPVIRMGDISTLHVRVEFDEENAVAVKPAAQAKAVKRGDPSQSFALKFVRVEPFVTPKQNLAVAGQRVDTRVLQVIYALPPEALEVFSGQQMDVFVETGRAEVQS